MHPRCCRPAASSVHYTTSCKHSLVFLRMGETMARNMLSWFELLKKPLFLLLVSCLFYCISDAPSNKHQILLPLSSHCPFIAESKKVGALLNNIFSIKKKTFNIALLWNCVTWSCVSRGNSLFGKCRVQISVGTSVTWLRGLVVFVSPSRRMPEFYLVWATTALFLTQ